MLKFLKIARLKMEAKDAYLKYNQIMDRYDCGKHLINQINPNLEYYRQRFNSAMDQLKELDPNCPGGRL